VEVIYENRIAAADGGWTDFSDLHRVLRLVNETAGEAPYDAVEQVAIGFHTHFRRASRWPGVSGLPRTRNTTATGNQFLVCG
jgi:hypothetical protein